MWAFIQGATEPYDAQQADVAGLQAALGLAAGVYFMREKKRLGLGRSFLYAVAGITAGCLVGNLIEAWLRVDIVPLLVRLLRLAVHVYHACCSCAMLSAPVPCFFGSSVVCRCRCASVLAVRLLLVPC